MLMAAVAPSVLLPQLADRQRWKRASDLWIPNPDWETAEYTLIWHQKALPIRCGFSWIELPPAPIIMNF